MSDEAIPTVALDEPITTTATAGYTAGQTRKRSNPVKVVPTGDTNEEEETRSMAWAKLPENVKAILNKCKSPVAPSARSLPTTTECRPCSVCR